MTRKQRKLNVIILTFFETDPSHVRARTLRELAADPRLAGYSRSELRRQVSSLRRAGLLYKLPHRKTQNGGYVTTREGRWLRDQYRSRS